MRSSFLSFWTYVFFFYLCPRLRRVDLRVRSSFLQYIHICIIYICIIYICIYIHVLYMYISTHTHTHARRLRRVDLRVRSFFLQVTCHTCDSCGEIRRCKSRHYYYYSIIVVYEILISPLDIRLVKYKDCSSATYIHTLQYDTCMPTIHATCIYTLQ